MVEKFGNQTLYFSSAGELWKSDGTAAGTDRLIDINGSQSSFPADFANVNGTLYFTAVTSFGRELWTSNGTELGTKFVKDIADGAWSSSPKNLVNANGKLYFTALTIGPNSEAIYRVMTSDGTPAGTKPIPTSSVKYSGTPARLTAVDDIIYFTAFAEKNGKHLGHELLTYRPDTVIGSFKDTVNFVAGGPNFLIDTDATVTASSFTSFNGGSITFRTTMNTQLEDRFTIRNQGTGAGQIGAVGAEVSYGGVVIGASSGGLEQLRWPLRLMPMPRPLQFRL